MQAQAFMDRYTPRVLEIARNPTTDLLGNSATSALLARLHADFENVTDKPGKRASLPGDDVLWWSITILEKLAEIKAAETRRDPYVLMMLDQLRSMAPRLENAEPLPPEFQIHWFDDSDG